MTCKTSTKPGYFVSLMFDPMTRTSNDVQVGIDIKEGPPAYSKTTGSWTGLTPQPVQYTGSLVTKQADGGVSIVLGLSGPTSGGGTLHVQNDPYSFNNCSYSYGS
jgi:hypothetical protein